MEEKLSENIFYYRENPPSSGQKDKFTLYYDICNCGKAACQNEIVNNNLSFIGKLRRLFPTEVNEFLDYHYNKYKGDPKKFLTYTRHIVNGHPDLEGTATLTYINEWLDDKKDMIQQNNNKLNNKEERSIITERQQGLIIYYLQNKLTKIDRTQNNLQLARFFAFLLNKSPKNIKDWKVYKTILNPLKCTENKSITALKSDLEIVKEQFQELRQAEIVAQIEKDIEKIFNK